MSKLFFLTLAAFVVCGLAKPGVEFDDGYSQLALFEPNDVEVSGLSGEKKDIFEDFCLSSRDEVKAFLQSTVNNAASRVFNVMFNTITEVNEELSKVQVDAVRQGAELIKESGVEQPAKAARTEEELEANISANLEKVKRRGLVSTIGDAVKTVFQAVFETISSETTRRLALLKAQFNGENARDKIHEACDTITRQVKYDLKGQLRDYKSGLTNSPQSPKESLKSIIASTELENVGCVTTNRITMVARFCDYLVIIGPVLYPLVGL